MKQLFIISSIAISLSVFSQTKTIDIKIDSRQSEVQNAMYIPGKGTVVNTEEIDNAFHVPKLNCEPEIALIDNNMNLVWKQTIKKDRNGTCVSSANSSGVYYVYFIGGSMYAKKKLAFGGKKISWDGKVEDVRIDNIADKISPSIVGDQKIEVMFLDNDILYVIQRYKADKISKVYLVTINLKTKEHNGVDIALPDKKFIAYVTHGWRYMGHGDGKIYFNTTDPGENESAYPVSLATVDYGGNVISVKETKLDVSPKYAFLSMNYRDYNDAVLGYEDMVQRGNTNELMILDFGSVKLSADKKYVYFYGMARDEEGIARKRTGYFIAKYTINGEKVWQTIYPLGSAAADQRIVLHGSRSSLCSYFSINENDGTVIFHFWENSKKTFHAIASAADGKLVDFITTTNTPNIYNSWLTYSVPTEVVPITSKKMDSKLNNVITTKGYMVIKKIDNNYLLIERMPKDGVIKAYLFSGEKK